MWLEGTTADGTAGRDRATHTHKGRYSCSLALPKRSISFFDIIICVITYEAIKQTSVPISSPFVCPLLFFRFLILFSPAICAPIASPLLFIFNLLLAPLPSYHLLSSPLPLLLFLPSSVTPDKVSISACWLSHCRLYACLTLTGTLGTGDTHHRMPITLPHVSGECVYVFVCVYVCVFMCKGWWGCKMPITLRVWSLLHWREFSGA